MRIVGDFFAIRRLKQMLIGQFLGTSAAEGIPAPFCRCYACEDARKHPENQRLRTSFRIDEKMLIDLGADAPLQAMRYGDFTQLRHVLITHTHDDHLNGHMMMQAFWGQSRGKPLHYYFTDKAYDIVEQWCNNSWILKGKVADWKRDGIIVFHRLEYFSRYEINGIGVIPFEGNHRGNMGENSAMYLLEFPDGRKLFYGLDSGKYPEKTLRRLKEYKIDIFISEATMGTAGKHPGGQHQCLEDVKELAEYLLKQGTLDETSQLFLTHISHRTSHGDMVKAVNELKFPVKTTVCYDGIKLF